MSDRADMDTTPALFLQASGSCGGHIALRSPLGLRGLR